MPKVRTSSGVFILMTMLSRMKYGLDLMAFRASNILPYCLRYKLRGCFGSNLFWSSLTALMMVVPSSDAISCSLNPPSVIILSKRNS